MSEAAHRLVAEWVGDVAQVAAEPPAIPETADFLAFAIRTFAPATARRVLDFGCGRGGLVEQLAARGFDSWGCDFPDALHPAPQIRAIARDPYRLPFADETFDAVVSTSVLEHAQNKAECFAEIHRVLARGGVALHIYPGKWYLPREPHMQIPLASWFWPRRPRAWYALCAAVGFRNAFQRGMPRRELVELNLTYARDWLSYWSTIAYRRLSLQIFGNASWPMSFFIAHSPGGVARLGRALHMPGVVGAIARETRMAFLVQRKE